MVFYKLSYKNSSIFELEGYISIEFSLINDNSLFNSIFMPPGNKKHPNYEKKIGKSLDSYLRAGFIFAL